MVAIRTVTGTTASTISTLDLKMAAMLADVERLDEVAPVRVRRPVETAAGTCPTRAARS